MALLAVEDLSVSFPSGRGRTIPALQSVTLDIQRGERLALVGESGSGKSTLARALLRLIQPQQGQIRFRGNDIGSLDRAGLRDYRRQIQMVFQDAIGSLNPRMTVAQTLCETIRFHRKAGDANAARRRAVAILHQVGLDEGVLDRYPRELSGGQCQRVSVARALVVEPSVLIADEPVSALDVSVQARVLRLLDEIRRAMGLTLVLIAHDLAMARQICDRMVVLHAGHVIEDGTTTQILTAPRHPQTRALIDAIPSLPPDSD